MTQASAAPAAAGLRVNPLQRLWLREIGIEKTWLRAPAPLQAAPTAAEAPVARATAPAAAPSPAVPMPAAPTPAAPVASPAAATPAPAAGAAPAADRVRIPVRSGPPPKPVKVEEAAAQEERTPAERAREVAARAGRADLDELEGLVSACTACGLCEGRKHAVFGTGARQARWLVVGEAPGEQEDRQGLPFVGRSGQLLDAMLASIGMSREQDVFIANVIKCRPPGNRNPKPEEVAACSPYLMRQIALLKPERILVLGRFAAQTLLGTDATIGSLRGRVHSLKTDEGVEIPMVVSYHPAYLLRSPVEKARAWQDLQLAVAP
ncbi:uracil-DNA glycosylase [Bordetella genomosp. 1]|uniref:Type-4 uracil-DNA glycosylase n=1 Tax=Bordetella genomosp. 1 TaxID=1395607 RepID=A0A261SP87_9BORD|nr:uracil-DNA glycosylase [Bordetella genomosp. 1]OZI39199.1 uracil-DNA glycosylase [Bordetella genomosp. 1]